VADFSEVVKQARNCEIFGHHFSHWEGLWIFALGYYHKGHGMAFVRVIKFLLNGMMLVSTQSLVTDVSLVCAHAWEAGYTR